MQRNQLVMDATVLAIETLRHTPAGLPRLALTLGHESQQMLEGASAAASFELQALAFGATAEALAKLGPGAMLTATGHLNRKSRFAAYPILHITQFQLH